MNAGDCETAVRDLAIPFQGSAARDRLMGFRDPPEDLQDDLNALENVKVSVGRGALPRPDLKRYGAS